MSLDPRDSRTRGRSKSPGRRDSSRSRVVEREEYTSTRAPSPPSSRYDTDPRDRGYDYEERETTTVRSGRDREPAIVTAEPRGSRDSRYGSVSQYQDRSHERGGRDGYGMPGSFTDVREEERDVRYTDKGVREKDYYKETTYDRKDKYGRAVSPPERSRYESDTYTYEKERDGRDRHYKSDKHGYDSEKDRDRGSKNSKYTYEHERDRDRDRERETLQYEDPKHGRERRGSFNIAAGHTSISGGLNFSHDKHGEKSQYVQPPDPLAYGASDGPNRHASSYAEPPQWEYAQPDQQLTYTRRQETTYDVPPAGQYPPRDSRDSRDSRDGRHHSHSNASYTADSARSSKSQILTVEPGSRHRREPSPGPGGLAPRMHSLSVSTGHHGGAAMSLANAPGSPLLEAYHGTYQSISPMPSPLLMASHSHSDANLIEPLSPLSSDEERRGGKKGRRTARFHDPEEEANILAKALKGEKRGPETQPLIDILPGLTHDQVLELRVQYKRIVKTGSEKKGVNIAKHIKLRLKDEDSSLMKACYVCALGRWESEAYWANFWYQGEKNRRELLIESLMGRTNSEIREIKEGFSDKKYSDSLTKCMKTELKEDKFKKAVLLVLDERKMEERSGYGVDKHLVEDDVHDLHKALRSEKGGESAMISIIVVRSDGHLKEVLRLYETTYRTNFAREMLKKSGNLVGELLAHILNGVINKPVRDALLVHHALSLSKSDSIRTELLISRLVRYHWDRPHMEAVKREYLTRYGIDMQRAVAEGTRGEWGAFCEMLCVRRMGDEVREVRRVDEYRVERR